MAKKTKDTKLPKPKDDDFGLDDDDFGADFGDIEGLDDDRDPTNPSKAGVAKQLAKEAADGAFSSTLKNVAKKTLPDEYSANYYEAMDLANYTKEVVDRNKQALNKSTYKLGKEVKKILPFKLGILDRYLENQESNFETQKTESEDQMRDTAVKGELAGIFDKQLEVQKVIEAKRDAQAEMDKKEQLIQNQMSQDVLTSIDSNIAQQTAFTIQISKEYYRRSLELQFKSFYVQSDMLRLSKEYFKGFAAQFTNIEKNTGLPDFVKLKTGEKLRDIMREQTVQSVYKQVFSNNKYMETIKKRVGGVVDEKIRDVTDAADGITDMLDNMSSSAEGGGGSAAGMLAGVAASMGGDTAGEKIAGAIVPKFGDTIKNSKLVKTGANYMGMLGNSVSTLLEHLKSTNKKMVDDNSGEGSPTEFLKSKLGQGLASVMDIATPGAEKFEVKNQGYLGHMEPAIFDNRVYRSITDVIPMYLAGILAKTSDLKTMYGMIHPAADGVDTPQLSYDFKNRKLDSIGNIKINIENDLFKNKSSGNKAKVVAKTMLSETSKAVGDNTTLSDKQKKDTRSDLNSKSTIKNLTMYLDEVSKDKSKSYSYDDMIMNYETNPELLKIVNAQGAELKKVLNSLRDNKVSNSENLDTKIKDLTRIFPVEPIKRLVAGISRIAATGIPHILTNETAESLSRIFGRFVLATEKAVTSAVVVDGSVFNDRNNNGSTGIAVEEMTDDLKTSVKALMRDCKKILAAGDSFDITSMELLFSEVDVGSRAMFDLGPKTFNEIKGHYPDLIQDGFLGIEQLVEGKIGSNTGDKVFVNSAEIMELGRVNALDLKNARTIQNSRNLLDNAVGKMKEMTKFVTENRNDPSKVLGYLKQELATVKTSVSEQLTKNIGDLTKLIKDKTGLEGITSEGGITKKALLAGIKFTDDVTAKIDKQITMLEKDLQERTALVAEAVVTVESAGLKAGPTTQTSKITGLLDARKKNLVKVLNAVKASTAEQRKALVAELEKLNATGTSTAEDKVKGSIEVIKSSIENTITKVKASLEEYEKANAEAQAVAA